MVNNQRYVFSSQGNARNQSNLSQTHSIILKKLELHGILPQEHFSKHMVPGVPVDLEGSMKGEGGDARCRDGG